MWCLKFCRHTDYPNLFRDFLQPFQQNAGLLPNYTQTASVHISQPPFTNHPSIRHQAFSVAANAADIPPDT
jgi:hypothetical protein